MNVAQKLAMSYHRDPAHTDASARFDRAMAAMEAKQARGTTGRGFPSAHSVGGGVASSSTPNLSTQQPRHASVPPLDFSRASREGSQRKESSPHVPHAQQQPQQNDPRAANDQNSDIFKRSLDALERERASLVRLKKNSREIFV